MLPSCKFCFLSTLALVLVLILTPTTLIYLRRDQPRIRGMIPLITPLSTYGITHATIPSQKDKTIIITGANAGLGFSTSKILASKQATVIMACRSETKCQHAMQRIKKLQPDADISSAILDLASLKSVQKFASNFIANHPNGLDALILNAGIMMCPFSLTKDNIETQFGVNHVAHHYLTTLLLPSIEKKAATKTEKTNTMSHIVSVSSSAAFRAYPNYGISLTLNDINNSTLYNRVNAYGQSKLSNILFVQELQNRILSKGIQNIVVTAVHPGAVETELPRHIVAPLPLKIQSFFMASYHYFATKGFVWLSDDAALSQIYAMSSPEIELNPKKFYGKFIVPLGRISEPPQHTYNVTLQQKLWTFTEDIIHSKMTMGMDQGDEKELKGIENGVEKEEIVNVEIKEDGTSSMELDDSIEIDTNSEKPKDIDSTSTSDQNKVTDASLTSSQTIHPGATPPPIVLPTQATAIFGAGCYWSVELSFQRLPGVISTSVGFIGGSVVKPYYKEVARGRTGHAEAVQVIYNPNLVTYDELLIIFFSIHDATQLNRQGPDKGTQYRSMIVTSNEEQYIIAMDALNGNSEYQTQLLKSSDGKYGRWWPAEDDHQQYLEKGGQTAKKGSLKPIQCYGNRGPIKYLSKKKKLVELFQRKIGVGSGDDEE